MPELITNGENGFMEPVGDIAAQAARVVELLTDDALHQRITAAGRHRALEYFGTDRIIPQYEQYYREALIGASSLTATTAGLRPARRSDTVFTTPRRWNCTHTR